MRIEPSIERLEQVVGIIARQLGTMNAIDRHLRELLQRAYDVRNLDQTTKDDIERLANAVGVTLTRLNT
jgi:hypothetical protein